MKPEKIVLRPENQEQFENILKMGIVKQLHAEGMLTNAQLSFILSDLQSNTCALHNDTCTSLANVVY